MSSRYFAPAVSDLTKITLRGGKLVKALVNHPSNDIFTNPELGVPSYEPSSDRWRIRFGYLVYELDPAEADSKNKTANALTDGNLGTSVSYTFNGDSWVNVGPSINMGELGTYLYLVKYDVSHDPDLLHYPPLMRLVAYPPTGGEVLYSSRLELTDYYHDLPHEPYTFGTLVRGKQSFQLQVNPLQLDATLSPLFLTVYEISVYRL
jgi:hypothetical protein